VTDFKAAYPLIVSRRSATDREQLQCFDGEVYEGARHGRDAVTCLDRRVTRCPPLLPLSIIPTLLMYFVGFRLNIVSLLALSLIVGILVDDAIVKVENVFRHIKWARSFSTRQWKLPPNRLGGQATTLTHGRTTSVFSSFAV
jgi:AcrB/AcrD/AcrF family